MPRVKVLSNPYHYGGYELNPNYSYNEKILNESIIRPLEYFRRESINSGYDYQVIEATIAPHDSSAIDYVLTDLDDPLFSSHDLLFNVGNIKKVLEPDKFWWSWTKEFSKYRGTHYHLMIVYCNELEVRVWPFVQKKLQNLAGVKTAFVSSRQNFENERWCHYLKDRGKHGIDDAVTRHCYRAKLNQKIDVEGRSFGKCKLKPLSPINRSYLRPQYGKEKTSFSSPYLRFPSKAEMYNQGIFATL